ncbi:NAD(P)-binding domain-containing protein [Streptomyces sp. NBC_01142]|uniref:NAD(P)-dependent oxidoreductase n=1 Tax=Streptomyces sp. NBC_01142 TaxID=2975865 RepID=UPI00224F2D9E|nr:NAD(P)-binding domain-containing protein [Streptomyces sp. NBC_01142]MCX4824099.1 NAD(P)-binding domain-containing protein [Streptomyces sp. NBC_01142]
MSSNVSQPSVTVIGLGPMGQAMVNAFLDRGHGVTVWNRTASRADALVARGAVRADSIEEALAAHELVVLSLTDYDAMYAILGSVDPQVLAGRVLVNLSSDTPEKARAAARWAAERGAVQLTGGVMAAPYMIGTSGASTVYSGPREVFDAHRTTLEALTGTDHKGEDPGLAALFYQLSMAMFWTSMVSYWQAIAMAQAHGLTAADILPYANSTLGGIGSFLDLYAERIDAGDHRGDVDRLAMGLASMEHVVRTAADAGVDTAIPAAVTALARRGLDAGHAEDSFSSLVELLKAVRPVDAAEPEEVAMGGAVGRKP